MKIYRDLEKNNCRESCFTPFPVMFIGTLQGFSGTQGNPVKFPAKIFAVWTIDPKIHDFVSVDI